MTDERRILLLQGPLSSLYRRLGKALRAENCEVYRVNFSIGDWLHWRDSNAIDYRGSPEAWPAFIANLLDSKNITDLVLHGDRRYYHKVAIREAQARGIYVAVTELGLLRPGRLTLEREGLGLMSHFPAEPARILQLADQLPTPEESPAFTYPFAQMAAWDVSYNLLNFFLFWLYPGYRKHTPYNPLLEYSAAAYRLLKSRALNHAANKTINGLIDDAQAYFVFPLQLSGDFQVRDYSPFSSMQEVIELVLQSFASYAPKHSLLLIKQHPLDPGLDRLQREVDRLSRQYAIQQRVRFIDGGDLGRAFSHAKGVVLINSSAAMQALDSGISVKCLAPAIFDMDGLTFQGTLDDFWNFDYKPDEYLFRALVKVLKHTTQIPGGLYGEDALAEAVRHISQRLLRRQLNEPGAWETEPPRLNSKTAAWFSP